MALKDWSTAPGSNETVGAINWKEGQLPGSVNNSAREMMSQLAYALGSVRRASVDEDVSLSDLVTALGSTTNVTARLNNESWAVSSDVTVPSNITLWLTRGGSFNVDASATLTIQGTLITEVSSYNSGAGTVTISGQLVDLEDLSNSTAIGNVFNVQNYGAIGDGNVADTSAGTDVTSSVQDAIDACQAAGGGTVFFPNGVYKLTELVPPRDVNINYVGESMEDTILFHQEGTSASPNTLFNKTGSDGNSADIGFYNFTIRGTRDTRVAGATRQGGISISCNFFDKVKFVNVYWLEHNWFPTSIKFSNEVTWLNCRGLNNCRDLFRAVGCVDVSVIGCVASHCGDDVVAAHAVGDNLQTDSLPAESVVISGNRFEDTRGIKCLGQRMITISNNVLRRCQEYAITTQTPAAAGEGWTQRFALNITGNVITDTVPRANGAGAADSCILVAATDDPKTGTTNTAVPGYLQSDATQIYTWDYRDTDAELAANPTIHFHEINISNNTVLRTLPAVTNYSDWGFGSQFDDENGDLDDPQMTDADMRPNSCLKFENGGFRRVVVSNNIFSHAVRGIRFPNNPDDDRHFEQFLISNNIISDTTADSIQLPTGAAFNVPQFVISGNLINADPYRLGSTSNTNGTYTGSGNPIGINIGSLQGVTIRDNHFMNVCLPINVDDANEVLTDHISYNNVCYGNPAGGLGFNASNVGIGYYYRQADGFRHVVIDADPTSATYLDLTNVMLGSNAAQPSSGTYVEGWFTKNRAALSVTAKNNILVGWLRLTTGSGHVAGTDWETVYWKTNDTEGT